MSDFNIVEIDSDPESRLVEKAVGVGFFKLGVSATTYFMAIDLSNTAEFPHEAGAGIFLMRTIGKALKSAAGAQWGVQLAIVLRIDGTDADLALLAQASISLRDPSTLSVPEQIVDLWPAPSNLTVVANDLTKFLTNQKEFNVAAINTATDLEDAKGNLTVNPAVGDLLFRVENVTGGGTVDFAYGIQYFVE